VNIAGSVYDLLVKTGAITEAGPEGVRPSHSKGLGLSLLVVSARSSAH
jgi:hypothetical protein